MNSPVGWTRGMIVVEVERGIAFLTLDRPEKLNAMDAGFWADLRAAIAWVEQDANARALVVRGAGDRAFSAGGDVAGFAQLGSEEQRRAFQVDAMAAFEAVATCTLPTIAAVRGYAFGGGCELAMACDMIVAAASARLGLPEARFGLVPGYGVLRAPAIVGAQLAKLMIFTGEPLTAEEALRHGLVQKVCADEDLDDAVFRIAAAAAAAPRPVIATVKALIGSALDPGRIRASVEAVTRLHATEESRRAVADFLA